MKVVELHLEDLIDKLEQGSLTESELRRLNAHLAGCPVCRFECAIRSALDHEYAEAMAVSRGFAGAAPPLARRPATGRSIT